ncbi:hypothetical protein [Ornithinimicrobium kibberense]|uniref:Uncharacterized protein n=1 Tax=Ornithinimicrobium kibberense TaxID=282060 RepID=A0ABV5UZF0_9MICO|nr:hypothetical protein [Ornithinimicrobium kibberense]
MDGQGRFENSLLRGGIEERTKRYGRRWPTGWFELDDLIGGGVERGRVTVVTGPEELRRAVTSSIALWGAAAGATTLLVGLQETPEQLQVRCVTSATGLTAQEVVRPEDGWAGARREALDEILRAVTLRAMTPSSMVPSHQLTMMQVELLVADDPWADLGALSTSLAAGPGWQRGAAVEDSLRHYAALSRAAVVTSGAATRMGRWRPHLRIDIAEPRRPGAGTTALVRHRAHEDVRLALPFAVDPDGVHRLPQPGPAAGWPDPPPPLALLDDRAVELLAARGGRLDLPGARGTCPECHSLDVRHHVLGMPAGPCPVEWVDQLGCVVGHAATQRTCEHCGHGWDPGRD